MKVYLGITHGLGRSVSLRDQHFSDQFHDSSEHPSHHPWSVGARARLGPLQPLRRGPAARQGFPVLRCWNGACAQREPRIRMSEARRQMSRSSQGPRKRRGRSTLWGLRAKALGQRVCAQGSWGRLSRPGPPCVQPWGHCQCRAGHTVLLAACFISKISVGPRPHASFISCLELPLFCGEFCSGTSLSRGNQLLSTPSCRLSLWSCAFCVCVCVCVFYGWPFCLCVPLG